jgi:hypothetical protein
MILLAFCVSYHIFKTNILTCLLKILSILTVMHDKTQGKYRNDNYKNTVLHRQVTQERAVQQNLKVYSDLCTSL